jgi:glycosyltransferase involved in cell wall biosynthesis
VAVKVLHWYPNFLHGGGCANAVRGLAAAEARQGAEVVVAAAVSTRQPLYQSLGAIPGVEVLEWRPTKTWMIGGQHVRLATRRESQRLAGLAPDVVHAHGEFNLDNLRVPRLFRCPLVFSPHGACHPVVLAKSRRLAKRAFLGTERILLRRHPRAYHALSPAEADHVAAVFPEAPNYCVPQGPSTFVTAEASSGHRPPRTWKDGVTFVFVGRLDVFTKGLDLLLEAFTSTVRENPGQNGRLVLAGPDWNGGLSWLQQRAVHLGIVDRVRFTGALRGEEVAEVLANADIYVQLSRHEGFPLSVAEALLARRPAVLSEAIGTMSYREIAALPQVRVVSPNAADAARAMRELAADLPGQSRAAECSAAALGDFFNWDRIARQHLGQYERLLGA